MSSEPIEAPEAPWWMEALTVLRCADDEVALRMALEAPPSPERTAIMARALMGLNRMDEAEVVLKGAGEDAAANPLMISALGVWERERKARGRSRTIRAKARRAIAALPERPHPATLVEDNSDLVVCPQAGASLVVVSFGLWLPMPGVDRLLASLGCSRVHIRDLQARFRADPMAVLRDREKLDAQILEACRSTGAGRMVMIGASGQGLGAIYWGARLKADAILAFSPISSLDPNVLVQMEDSRRDGDILGPVLEVLKRENPTDSMDALVSLMHTPTPTLVVCGDDHRFDCAHAERLATAPCVTLRKLKRAGHDAAAAAVARGTFGKLLAEATRG